MLKTLDGIDRKISGYIHTFNAGFLQFLVFPFAVFHNPQGEVCIGLFITFYLIFIEADLSGKGKENVTTTDQVAIFLHYLFYKLFLLICTRSGKRFFGRPRPENPQDMDPKPAYCRYFNLRAREKRNAMPSGDTA